VVLLDRLVEVFLSSPPSSLFVGRGLLLCSIVVVGAAESGRAVHDADH